MKHILNISQYEKVLLLLMILLEYILLKFNGILSNDDDLIVIYTNFNDSMSNTSIWKQLSVNRNAFWKLIQCIIMNTYSYYSNP